MDSKAARSCTTDDAETAQRAYHDSADHHTKSRERRATEALNLLGVKDVDINADRVTNIASAEEFKLVGKQIVMSFVRELQTKAAAEAEIEEFFLQRQQKDQDNTKEPGKK